MRPVWITLFLLLIAGIAFYSFPQIDITAAHLFYRDGQGFFLKNNPVVLFFYEIVPFLVGFFIVAGIAFLVIIILRRKPCLGLRKREVFYLLLVLLIGPGLLVNGVFKEYSGRARPSQIAEFAGSRHFSPAFTISNQCQQNCSFVSGHASIGFYFVAFALLASTCRRKLFILAILPGIAVGISRMAQGGHFLSDVVCSGLIVTAVAFFLHYIIIQKHTNSVKSL